MDLNSKSVLREAFKKNASLEVVDIDSIATSNFSVILDCMKTSQTIEELTIDQSVFTEESSHEAMVDFLCTTNSVRMVTLERKNSGFQIPSLVSKLISSKRDDNSRLSLHIHCHDFSSEDLHEM